MHFLTKPPLGPNAHAIANDQHSDHQVRINRRPANAAVKGCEFDAQHRQIKKPVNSPQHVISGNMLIQPKIVE